ncbi:hypothetical protein [Ureaplasma canigenitalium]|uniref:hypothetical protein n=1 Tax=Ureaplasma canigenitalium TaxID=42092 RepID=UPI0012EBB5C1|nr:hypothetical protein [Ureaplasma canigenitalium]
MAKATMPVVLRVKENIIPGVFRKLESFKKHEKLEMIDDKIYIKIDGVTFVIYYPTLNKVHCQHSCTGFIHQVKEFSDLHLERIDICNSLYEKNKISLLVELTNYVIQTFDRFITCVDLFSVHMQTDNYKYFANYIYRYEYLFDLNWYKEAFRIEYSEKYKGIYVHYLNGFGFLDFVLKDNNKDHHCLVRKAIEILKNILVSDEQGVENYLDCLRHDYIVSTFVDHSSKVYLIQKI